MIEARGCGDFPGGELEDGVEDRQEGVARILVGGPEEVEMGVSQVCAWISSQ